VMPPPAAAPKIAKAPVAKVATKTTASSRAKAVTAAPKTRPAPAPRTGTTKRAATAAATTTKTVRVAEKATEFVSADAFDFGRPDLDDSITSVASSIDTEVTLKLPDIAMGPMTRARRRTSVFAPSRNSFVPPLRTPVKPPVEINQVLEEPETEETDTVEAPPVTSTAIKSTGGDSGSKKQQGQAPPVDLKLSEPLTPIVELKRMPSGEYKDSPARRKTVQKSQKKVKKADNAQVEKKSPLSAIPLNLTPLKSTKKKVQKQSVFLGTPKAVDPMNVLKKNLRQKVDKNLDDKVAGLPENSSPYAMLTGETENGTPVERFVKIQKKPTAEIAAKFVTGTPAPSLAARSTRRGTASKRHLAMSQVKVAAAAGSAASNITEDHQEEMVLERDGSPKLPKRNRRSSVFNGFPTPVASAKRRLSDDQGNHSDLEEESDENAPPATSSPIASPPKSSQLVTGDLVRACAIM